MKEKVGEDKTSLSIREKDVLVKQIFESIMKLLRSRFAWIVFIVLWFQVVGHECKHGENHPHPTSEAFAGQRCCRVAGVNNGKQHGVYVVACLMCVWAIPGTPMKEKVKGKNTLSSTRPRNLPIRLQQDKKGIS